MNNYYFETINENVVFNSYVTIMSYTLAAILVIIVIIFF